MGNPYTTTPSITPLKRIKKNKNNAVNQYKQTYKCAPEYLH